MSHGTYIHTMIYGIQNYAIETYIWNEVGKNEQQYLTSNTPSSATPNIVMYMYLRKSLYPFPI